ncbi:hypothetical protein [Streptomyces hiroshimensis]
MVAQSPARAAVATLAEGLYPKESLITPDTMRQLGFEPRRRLEADAAAKAFTGYDAHLRQIEHVTVVPASDIA